MIARLKTPVSRITLLSLSLGALLMLPALAAEKEGMPDLAQDEQTCLPYSTANLLLWFGNNGYPKLIADGENQDKKYLHTVHLIMADTDARFDMGTRINKITDGIKKYINDSGYDCDVEYRGLGKAAFSQDWLKENDDPNKGFVLLLEYINYNEDQNVFTNAWDAGHAVTLVSADPKMIIIHDPAHDPGEVGRKIITPQLLTGGVFVTRGGSVPVSGLLLLSGSQLEAPPDAGVMLTGAVCVTMHPVKAGGSSSTPAGGANSTVGGGGATTAPTASSAKSRTWAMWLFDLFFTK